jgi:hypothetical protein
MLLSRSGLPPATLRLPRSTLPRHRCTTRSDWALEEDDTVAARRILLGASCLMLITGLGFTSLTDFWPLLLVAIAGTLNPSGGEPGAPGRNLLNGEELPAKATGTLKPGDRLRMETPGGGGHGAP